ncbi:C-type lectin domain family 4 member M-like isoform X1 [Paramisgurnus dabryanus]|uniref:C-type lectin domain family 4 member M-like isoform X1 n=1 Tax=Paramisgurnus dabryanus TaxID=90735 RepID=UPI003CCF7C61
MDTERVEADESIYVNTNDFKTETNIYQPPQHTESKTVKNRCCRKVTVCLVLLCVLLLTAVIVLCVLIYTNNQQCHNDIKKLSKQEKDALWRDFNDGWIYFQSSLYISSEKKNWTESRRYCRERGADLIIINNKEEQNFISNMSGVVWIGLSDSDEEGKWKWVDNTTLNSGFWKAGEPSNLTTENCVVNQLSLWSDYKCNGQFKGICEKEL